MDQVFKIIIIHHYRFLLRPMGQSKGQSKGQPKEDQPKGQQVNYSDEKEMQLKEQQENNSDENIDYMKLII